MTNAVLIAMTSTEEHHIRDSSGLNREMAPRKPSVNRFERHFPALPTRIRFSTNQCECATPKTSFQLKYQPVRVLY